MFVPSVVVTVRSLAKRARSPSVVMSQSSPPARIPSKAVSGRRVLAAVLATAVATATAVVLVPAPTGAAPTVSRLAGADRYGTAVEISKAAFAAGLDTVFVANGTGFADAMAGGPAATRRRAPVLLVERDRVPGVTADELN